MRTLLTLTRSENKKLNLEEYKAGKFKLRSRPRFLIVELTQGCNLKCPMCRPQIIPTQAKRMTGKLFYSIAEELFPTAEMVDLRGWGESLILPDIIEYIEATAQYGTKIRFVTNLMYRRPEILESLIAYNCQVAISLDTTDPELFRYIRGGANFQVVSENLEILMKGFSERYGNTDNVYFTTVVQNPSIETLPLLVDFAADKGVKEIRMFSVTAEHSSPLSIEHQKDRVDKALRSAANRARERGVRLIAGSQLGSLPENSPGMPACVHPWAYVYFAYNGSVGFCDHLIGLDGEPYLVGHLDVSSFDDIWNGLEWQTLRHEHLTTRDRNANKFRECDWCYKYRYIDFEYLFDPNAGKRIVYLSGGPS